MDMIERYLQAVRFWLPGEQKDDITAELSEDLHAQVMEQESALKRKLNQGEIEAILRQRGRPMLVANHYAPPRYLIGPMLFPIYRFVLKIVLACYLVPWALVTTGLMFFNPGYRAAHIGHVLGSVTSSLWFTGFVAIGTVTIVFAVLERANAKSHFLEEWDPRKLPPARNFNLITRSSSSFELAANLVAAVWWAANMSSPIVLNSLGVRIVLSPVWAYFFWGFLVLTVVNTVQAAVNLMRPYWTGTRATVRLLTDCAGSVLFCWLLKANVVTGFFAATVSSERAVQIAAAIDLWMARMFPAGIALAVLILGIDIFRIVRLKTVRAGLPWEATVSA